MSYAGFGKLQIGADEEADARFRQSVEMNRNCPLAHVALAAALANLGRLAEARAAAQAGLALDSTFTLSRYRAGANSDNPTYLAQRERISEGVRKAGVPEDEWQMFALAAHTRATEVTECCREFIVRLAPARFNATR